MAEFFNNVWIWIQLNLIPTIVIAVLFVALVVTIVIACVKSSKLKKARKALAKAKAAPAAKPAPVAQTAPAKPVEEKKEEVKPAPAPVAKPAPAPVVEEKKAEPVEEKVEDKKEEVVEEKKAPVAPAKKPVAKPAAKTATAKPAEAKAPAKKFVGKWIIEYKADKEYMTKLLASNGEVMLSSEIYSSEEGARSGIATIINNVSNGKFVIYKDKNGNSYYKLKTVVNRLLCVGEIYKTNDQCLKAVESVKRIAADAVVAEGVVEGSQYIDYTPEKVTGYEAKKGLTGKWKIETTPEGKYSAKLYASNGQLMLATEEVALLKSAEAAIEAVKKNSLSGNFIIDKDKFGRFYYKLRNAQKSVICIGEAYEKLESCISALESVRRFAYTAVMATDAE